MNVENIQKKKQIYFITIIIISVVVKQGYLKAPHKRL